MAKSTYIVIKSRFNRLFQSKFEAGFELVTTKSIKMCSNYVEKIKTDRVLLIRDRKDLNRKSQNILTFLINFVIFDLLINYFRSNFD